MAGVPPGLTVTGTWRSGASVTPAATPGRRMKRPAEDTALSQGSSGVNWCAHL